MRLHSAATVTWPLRRCWPAASTVRRSIAESSRSATRVSRAHEWFGMNELNESVWPVDLDQVRLWPMESEDGLLLQELFDDRRFPHCIRRARRSRRGEHVPEPARGL